MRGRLVRLALTGILLVPGAGVAAQPIAVMDLQRLLQAAPTRELHFHETRESPWLPAPVVSSGSMKYSGAVLEKTTEQPRREVWRILPDRMQLIGPDAPPRQLMFADAPGVAALANALRAVMAGDLKALEKDFHLMPGGDERLWTLQLTPRRVDIGRFLKQLELQGTGTRLQVIVILETQGDRTTTRLTSQP